MKIKEYSEFPKRLTEKEKLAWESFVGMVKEFWDNQNDENYVKTLIKICGQIHCRISLIPFLTASRKNAGVQSEKQGNPFD